MTALATAIYENEAAQPSAAEIEAHRIHMGHQLAGIEKLEGTYPYTLERSVKGYRLNKFLHEMVVPAHRKKFLENPEALFEAFGLTAEERDLVPNRACPGMIHYGLIF